MQTQAYLALLASTLLGAVSSAPTSSAEHAVLDERALVPRATSTWFKLCKDIDFNACTDWGVFTGYCYNLPNEFNDVISSVKSAGNTQCYIYTDLGCGGTVGGPVTNDDRHNDLRTSGWNDVVSSFECVDL